MQLMGTYICATDNFVKQTSQVSSPYIALYLTKTIQHHIQSHTLHLSGLKAEIKMLGRHDISHIVKFCNPSLHILWSTRSYQIGCLEQCRALKQCTHCRPFWNSHHTGSNSTSTCLFIKLLICATERNSSLSLEL